MWEIQGRNGIKETHILRENKGHNFSSTGLFLSGQNMLFIPPSKKKNFLNPLSPPARPLLCDPFNVQTPQKKVAIVTVSTSSVPI